MNYTSIKNLLGQPKKIVIISHINPDGDALGSTLGMYHFLKKQNPEHEVNIILPNNFPVYLKWMQSSKEILLFNKEQEKSIELIKQAEIFFFLDLNNLPRTGDMENLFSETKAKRILIDHHPNPDENFDYAFSNTNVSSTAELVFNFIDNIGYKNLIDKTIAECLFTGILTDTGCFSFSCSHPEVYETVAFLLKFGIDKRQITYNVFDNYSETRMRLLGHCLEKKMKVFRKYNTAYIYLTEKELDEFKYQKGDSEGFVNQPLSIKGMKFAAFFMEKDGLVKASFRSKGDFSVNLFSNKHFNGGGHTNAAGGRFYGTMEEALDSFEKLLPLYKEELQNSTVSE